MKVKILPLAALVAAAFAFGIAGASALGYWITESGKSPARVAEGPFAGQPDPADIRGSYTFGDVENAFGVPASILAEAFGFRDRPASEVKAKDVEAAYAGKTGDMEVGTDAVRLFVAAWKGMPFEPEPTTALPAGAAALLEGRELHPATAALVRSRTAGGDAGFGTLRDAASPSSSPAEAARPAAPEVKGQTTFGDLEAWGLTEDGIRQALGGLKPGPASQTVRDYCLAAGVEFSEVRARLQDLLDR